MSSLRGNLRGHVDFISPNSISGWIESRDRSENHEILCCECHTVVARFSPNLSRPDVQRLDPQLVNSGFKVALSNRTSKLHSGHTFRIVQGGHEFSSPELIFPESSEICKSYVFVCELFDYLTHEPNVSGIQRYVLDILEEFSNSDEVSGIAIVGFDSAKRSFFQIDRQLLELLTFEYSNSNSLYEISKQILEDSANNEVKFQSGDSLISLGALWGVPTSYHTIRKLVGRGIKFVPFIYDLIPVLEDEMHSADDGVIRGFSQYLSFCCRFASHICHLSNQTKFDFDKWSSDKFGVHIASTVFGAIPRNLKYDEVSNLVSNFGSKKFVLQVGTLEPRKCHKLTLKAFRKLISLDPDFDIDLVIAGRKGWRMDSDWELFDDSFSTGRVHHFPDISDRDLQFLYSKAIFSVFPSTYEGWGLPISESLLRGTPCLVRRAGSMIEAGGEHATYFENDTDFGAIFARLCTDEKFLNDEISRAKKFTLRGRRSPFSYLEEVTRIEHKFSPLPKPLLRLGKEYCFRQPEQSSSSGNHLRSLSPFTSKILSQVSFVDSQIFLTGQILDTKDCWLLRDSSVSFRAPANTKLVVMMALNIETAGLLRIKWSSNYIEKYVVAGMNLLSFDLNSGSTGEVELSFLHKNIKHDPRQLEVGIDSILVTESDDFHIREMALHHWVNAGRNLATEWRS